MKNLFQALGRAPNIFAEGTKKLSNDEAWLLRIIISFHGRDYDSAVFLIRSRILKSYVSGFTFLVQKTSETTFYDD